MRTTKKMAEKPTFKTTVKGTDRSIYDHDLTIHDVIQLKVDHIIERLDYPPYIAFPTIYQMLWSDSTLFTTLLENDPIRVGLIGHWKHPKHIAGRPPTKNDKQRMVDDFGFSMIYPPISLMNLIKRAFNRLIDKCIDEKLQILPAPFTGYIDPKTEKLIMPNWCDMEWHGAKITGYEIMKIDEHSYSELSEYMLNDALLWQQLQHERTRKTAPEIRESQRRSAIRKAERAEKRLLSYDPLLALETGLDNIDWDALINEK